MGRSIRTTIPTWDGQVDAEDNTTYWNSGAGWVPIGTASDKFRTTFEGNGHAIRHLFIKRSSSDNVGLFGYTGLAQCHPPCSAA